MKELKLASSYANALFDLAQEQNLVEPVNEDMKLIAKVLDENREFRQILKSPVIKNDVKQKIFDEIFKDAVSELTHRFFDVIIKKNRDNYLRPISEKFVELYRDFKGIKSATVTTATPLKDETRTEFVNILSEKLNKTIELEEKVDDKLLGGFVLKVDHSQFDASMRKKLDKLSRQFDVNVYEKGF